MDSTPWHRLELLLAVILTSLGLVLTVRYAHAMATTSLSTDEFGTVGTFSAKGPLRVVTDYRAPKNHIFFNLLNSVLPERKSLHPTRVRALSILATLLAVGLAVGWCARRGRWLEGSVLLALWSTAPQLLRVSMEARGYGFLALFATAAAIAVVEYFRSRRRGWLWALAAAVALGAYTLPNFLFFAGPLLAALWLVDRTRWSLLAGMAASLAILALYAPVLPQLLAAFSGYGSQGASEADFRNIHGLVTATKLYFFSCEDWQAWCLVAGLALAPIAPLRQSDGKAMRVIAAGCIAFFVILLILRNPPLRVAAFCFLPLGIAGLWTWGGWVRELWPAPARVALCAVLAVFLGGRTFDAIRTFDFTPTEDWLLTARAVDRGLPDDLPIDFKRYAKYLQQTLPGADARAAEFDSGTFAAGRLVVADASNKWAEGRRFTPPAGLADVMQWIIPGTIRDITLYFRLPPAGDIPGIPSALRDRDPETAVSVPPDGLKLRLAPAASPRTAVLFFRGNPQPGEIAAASEVLLAGNAAVVAIAPEAAAEITLLAQSGRNLEIREVMLIDESELQP